MSDGGLIGIIAGSTLLGLVLVGGCMAGYPQYRVYDQRLAGEAELESQKYQKQVAVQAALAKKESAGLLAEAEILRANGVAQANRIIGDSLKNNEAYLRYLWIHNLEEGKGNQVIYIPTEANMPILEAGKREVRP
jgi:regulator of protease activity HflC (stomatin/prohibitin superfamily)